MKNLSTLATRANGTSWRRMALGLCLMVMFGLVAVHGQEVSSGSSSSSGSDLDSGSGSGSWLWREARQQVVDTLGLFNGAVEGVASDPFEKTPNLMYFAGMNTLTQALVTPFNESGFVIEILAKNDGPLPAELVNLGFDHIGDIDIYNGTVYAPIGNKQHQGPVIGFYSTTPNVTSGEPFPFLGYTLTNQSQIPWITVVPSPVDSTLWVLSSEFDEVDSLYVYHFESSSSRTLLEPSFNISITTEGGTNFPLPLYLVQGGSFTTNNATLYLNLEDPDYIITVLALGLQFDQEGRPTSAVTLGNYTVPDWKGEAEGIDVINRFEPHVNQSIFFIVNELVYATVFELAPV